MTAKCISFVSPHALSRNCEMTKIGYGRQSKSLLASKISLCISPSGEFFFSFIFFFYKNTIIGFCARHCGSVYKSYAGIAARTAKSQCHSDDYIKSNAKA